MKKKSVVEARLIPALKILADPDHQKKLWWPNSESPPWECYSEAVISFDEACMIVCEEEEEEENSCVNEQNYKSLLELSKMTDEFAANHDEVRNPNLLLQNPKWQSIVTHAQSLLQSLIKERSND